MTNTYEILGYKSQKDFDNFTSTLLDEGLMNITDAMKNAKDFLIHYPIVKVQSYDREYIEILKRDYSDDVSKAERATILTALSYFYSNREDAIEATGGCYYDEIDVDPQTEEEIDNLIVAINTSRSLHIL